MKALIGLVLVSILGLAAHAGESAGGDIGETNPGAHQAASVDVVKCVQCAQQVNDRIQTATPDPGQLAEATLSNRADSEKTPTTSH